MNEALLAAQPANTPGRTGISNASMSAQARMTIDQEVLSLDDALARLEIENRLKEGAENMLQVLDTMTRETPREIREARRLQVTEELNQTNARIAGLKHRITEMSPKSSAPKVYRRQRSDEKLSTRPKLATIKSYSSTKQAADSASSQKCSTSEILAEISVRGQDASASIAHSNNLVQLLKKNRSIKHDICRPETVTWLVHLLSSTVTNMVAAGFRLARYILCDQSTAKFVLDSGIERCLVISLAKDHRHALEREQAIKFIRSLLSTDSMMITSGMVRALISLAEADDRLSLVSLQTLAEMVLYCPELLAACGGNRCLLKSLSDGTPLMSDEVVMVFVHALDTPATRQHLDPYNDLQMIFASFTEYIEGRRSASFEDRLITSSTVLARMLNSWPGLLGLSMHKSSGIRSIVDALYVPNSMVRESILDLLFIVLSIPMSNMSSIFLAGRRLTTLGRIPLSAETSSNVACSSPERHSRKSILLGQFAALKLQLFLEVGILDALMVVVEDNLDFQASRKATLLLGEVLQLSNTLLPLVRSRTLQSLPRLFTSAAKLTNSSRFVATSALFQIESLNRTRNKTMTSRIVTSTEHSNSKRGQRQVEQVKIKMGIQIDDSHFRTLLLDTQVLNTKNYTKWRWDTLTELIQGPLLNPKRLEESIRATKFMKRLLAFYRPFTHRFSAIRNTKPNQKYVKFGCLLLNTLLANPEGIKYLTESKLLRQLSECLAQLDPMNHVTASDALFSKARLEETLCHGYFDMVGTLSTHTQGAAMMERWRMFSSLYHLTDLRSRGDLIELILTHMDYTLEGHPRIIMSKVLTTGLLEIRLFATRHLKTLLFDSSEAPSKVATWAIRLLITQLYDPNSEVCEAAVQVLQGACTSPEHLEHIVNLRPTLEHLGDIGGPLLLRFLSTGIGFQYLQELDYVDREMDDWFHGRNEEYVTEIEAAILRLQAPTNIAATGPSADQLPAHFYGELAKTEQGVSLLLEKGHFTRYVDLLHKHWHENLDLTMIRKVKAALWAIGSIGATERGACFLQDSNVTRSVIDIARSSSVATLKGTAYLVIGLLSITPAGATLLGEYNWLAVLTSMGTPTGICVPENLGDVLNLAPWQPSNIAADVLPVVSSSLADPLANEILSAIANLSNHILANEAAKALIRLRQKYPEKFLNPKLYDRIFDILAAYNYKLAVRRFLIELFNTELLYGYMSRRNHAARLNAGHSRPRDRVDQNVYASREHMSANME